MGNGQRRRDCARFAGYARFGVHCYVLFDPLRLAQEELVPAHQLTPAGAYGPCGFDTLPGIGLGLRLRQRRFDSLNANWLRRLDASGELVLTGEERAGQTESRADRHLALLRAHGISSDNGTTD
ncbi:MAG: hypothetical protein OXL39_19635 [Caldilineaceae bacterium]|nr:hypothetical protein [Caldilineaceae bacterium]